MTVGEITAEPPFRRLRPPPAGRARSGRYLTAAVFLAPALVILVVWMVYPAVYTILRSFYGQSGYLGNWVGLDNYKALFTTSTLTTAIKNNAIWVAVVPAFVAAVGLIFAVLTERVRWSVAFKTVVFLPMAISAFATGVTWRLMYQQDPSQGAINALGRVVSDAISPPGVLSSAARRLPRCRRRAVGTLVLKTPLHPGSVAQARPDRDPADRRARRARSRPCCRRRKPATSSASSGATSSRAAAFPARSRRASSACPA